MSLFSSRDNTLGKTKPLPSCHSITGDNKLTNQIVSDYDTKIKYHVWQHFLKKRKQIKKVTII